MSAYKAVYRAREDGDYDFMAAFAVEDMPDDWPGHMIDWLRAEGEDGRIVEADTLAELPDVLTAPAGHERREA